MYRALKIYFEQEISAFQKQYIGRIIKQQDIAKLLTPAYLKAASAQNAWIQDSWDLTTSLSSGMRTLFLHQ